jgi:Tol biopolymer transport system component
MKSDVHRNPTRRLVFYLGLRCLICYCSNTGDMFGVSQTAVPSSSPTATYSPSFTNTLTQTMTPSFTATCTETEIPKGDGNVLGMIVYRDQKEYFTTLNVQSGKYTEHFSTSFTDPYSWSPDGREIVYAMESGGDHVIYRIKIDGTGNTPLKNDGYHPVWSHDGSRIAYYSHGQGSWALYVMDTQGELVNEVDPRTVYDSYPEWSSDDTRILYLYSYMASIINIMVANSNGIGEPELVTDMDGIYGQPHFSPDGDAVVFMSVKSGESQIYTVNIDGTGLKQLTNSANGNFNPVWSPDGSEILFMSNRDKDECTISDDCGMELYKMDRDGGRQIRLTNDTHVDFYPVWSSDGKPSAIFRK